MPSAKLSATAVLSLATWAIASAAIAATYYVSPQGNDANDGRSAERAWQTVGKVNAAAFAPGDEILFARGGEWRDSLKASSNGAPGKPIAYGAYGQGVKPKFWGSDVLPNAGFTLFKGNTYQCPSNRRIASVLVDHQFLLAGDLNAVLNGPNTWHWDGKTLYVNLGGRDPRTDKRLYTGCVRVDCIHSSGKNHLVFKDLIGDESADPRDGYAFRVMGSDDVRLENCEAYRAGRHHFGTINSTRFVGKSLFCAHAMPRIPGGATFYVSYSDASRKGDTHQWIDCAADHFENPGQRPYQVFYDHGEGLGPILIQNLTARGTIFSIDSTAQRPITVRGGRLDDGIVEIFGSHAVLDGLTITGNGTVDSFASDCVFQNMQLVGIKHQHGGWTGYSSAFVFRDGAKRNTIRFNTIVVDAPASPCVTLLGKGSETKCVGNIFVAGRVFRSQAGGPGGADLSVCDWNLYAPTAVIADSNGKYLNLAGWQALKFDGHSLAADPQFSNPAGGDFTLKVGSPARAAARVPAVLRPEKDFAGKVRGDVCCIGAQEAGAGRAKSN